MTDGHEGIPARLRDHLFEAVLAELVESGIDEFNLARVARRAGVDRRVIDRYFPDGRVLLMEAMLARARDAVPIPDDGSLVRDLRQFARSLAGLTGTTLGRQWFRRLVPGGGDADLSDVGPDFWAFQMAAVEQMFRQAAERGELRSDIDQGLAARMLAAALTYDMVYNDSPANPDYVEQVCSIFLDGARRSDNSGLLEDFHESEEARAVLRATCDGIVDPVALLEAVRDSDGHISDLIFREVNPAACTYLQRSRTELLGAPVTRTLPELTGSDLFERYVQAMATGKPVEVEDFRFFSNRFHAMRRFDLRGMPASSDWLAMIWRDVSERHRTQQQALIAERSIVAREQRVGASLDELVETAAAESARVAADALLDPQVLLEPARDCSGRIVDFVYREVNDATCEYLGLSREDLLGRGVVETLPGLKGRLLQDYIRCLETGEPLILNDFAYDNEILQDTRRYDLRVTRATQHCLTLTWRDVTDRFQVTQDLARSRDLLRATLDAMFDPQALVEVITTPTGETDLVLRDVNRAFCDYIDQQRPDLVGQSLVALFPNVVGAGLMERYLECAETGVPVVLDDVAYFTEFLNEPRRFDIRAAQVDVGLISLVVRDTTARFEAAQRLADSEEKYRLLAENTGDLVTHVRDGKIVWVSPSAERMLGAPAQYSIGREVQDLVAPEDQSALAARLTILAQGGTVQDRVRVVSLDGVTHWMHLHGRAFYDADGRQDGHIAALRMIDDEVAAEHAAEEARVRQARADALYRRSVDNAAIGMCLIDPDGRFVEVNESLCGFFGYAADTLTTKTWQELTAPEYLQVDLSKVNDVLEGRLETYRMVKQYVHADGHLIWGDLSVSCIRDEHGRVEYFISQITDVTAQVQAEQRLAESEEQYRLLVENTGDVVIHAHNGKFVWVSPAIEAVLAAQPQYWIGRDIREIVPPSDRAAFAERIQLLEAGGTIQRRSQVISVDGITHWVHIHAAPFHDAAGHHVGFTAALRVIDNEVAAETAAETARVRQARADALHRRSMESAAVGMCLARPEGAFVEVNDALCEFFGYDAPTLLKKTWIELTAPEYLQADLDKVADLVAGRIDSYRMVKQYIHADGHRLWGDLSVGCLRNRTAASKSPSVRSSTSPPESRPNNSSNSWPGSTPSPGWRTVPR